MIKLQILHQHRPEYLEIATVRSVKESGVERLYGLEERIGSRRTLCVNAGRLLDNPRCERQRLPQGVLSTTEDLAGLFPSHSSCPLGLRTPCYRFRMSDKPLLDQLLDPFTQFLDAESAQRVIEFGIAPAVTQRADYEALIDATGFIAILKLKAQSRLTSNLHP